MDGLRLAAALLTVHLTVGLAGAQGSIPPGAERPVAPTGSTVQGLEAEGTITRIDVAARTITLDNGVEYVILDSANPAWTSLKEGTLVKLRYSVDGGRNTATFLGIAR